MGYTVHRFIGIDVLCFLSSSRLNIAVLTRYCEYQTLFVVLAIKVSIFSVTHFSDTCPMYAHHRNATVPFCGDMIYEPS